MPSARTCRVVCETALSPEADSMAVSIGNARVCKRSCLLLFLVYLGRPGYIYLSCSSSLMGQGKRCCCYRLCWSLLCCVTRSCSLTHSLVLTPYTSSPKVLFIFKRSLPPYVPVSRNTIISQKHTQHPQQCNTQPPSSWPWPAWPLLNPPAPQPPAQQPHPPPAPTNPAAAVQLMRKKIPPTKTSLPDHTDNSQKKKHHHKLPRLHRPTSHRLRLQRLGLPVHKLTSPADLLRQLPVR
jgi:hypothetical protein